MKEAKPDLRLQVLAALLLAACSLPNSRREQVGLCPSPKVSPRFESRSKHPSTLSILSGRVVSIDDGDTIIVLDGGNQTHKIRLQGIDAPEGGQVFGDRSRQSLSDLVLGKDVTIEWFKRDRYGRIVGKVLVDGRDVCLDQVSVGMAWHYKYYQSEQTAEDRKLYADAETEARESRRGLWADANPIPPWDFRRGR